MRITAKGQVTIPLAIREELGLLPDSEVEFDIVGRTARIRKVVNTKGRGWQMVERLKGTGNKRMTTGQIMALTRGED